MWPQYNTLSIELLNKASSSGQSLKRHENNIILKMTNAHKCIICSNNDKIYKIYNPLITQ